MRQRWDGVMVCPTDWEPRHILDFYRTKPDAHALPFTYPASDLELYTNGYGFNATGPGQGAVVTPTGMYLPMPFTIEIMGLIRSNYNTAQTQISLVKYNGGYSIRVNPSTRTIDFLYWDNVGGNRLAYTPSFVLPLNTRFRISIVQVSAAQVQLYLNYLDSSGNLFSTSDLAAPTSTVSAPARTVLYFGANDVATEHLNGWIDDFRLFSTIKTGAFCNANWNKEISTSEAGLVSYWKFNDMAPVTGVFPTTTADSVITTNIATLSGVRPIPNIMGAAT
jgi:hypothetical protein